MDAPTHKESTPDIDKLIRAVLDSISDAALWRDDSQVADIKAIKLYGDKPGMYVTIGRLDD